MTLPASVVPHPEKNQSGFWYELRDAKERKLYHQVMQSPIPFDVEVFSAEGKESIRRQEVPNHRVPLCCSFRTHPEQIQLFCSAAHLRPGPLPALGVIHRVVRFQRAR